MNEMVWKDDQMIINIATNKKSYLITDKHSKINLTIYNMTIYCCKDFCNLQLHNGIN